MKKNNAAKLGAWVALLVAGVAVGILALAEMLSKGQGETLGTSDQVPWGVFVVGYAFFIGTSAGATIIGLMVHVFGRNDYRPLAITGLLVSLLSLVAALLLIAFDVGNIGTMLLVPWILRNPSSMFLYTSITYYAFAVILVGQLYFSVKLARGNQSQLHAKAAKYLAVAAVPVALWIQGGLFGVVKAREFWNSPLLPPHSMLAALVSGTAVVLLVSIITAKATGKSLASKQTLDHLGRLLALFVAATLLFDLVDAFVTGYSNTRGGAEIWGLLTGDFFGLYALNLGGLAVALAIVLFARGRSAGGLLVASLIAVIAIAAYRYDLVVVGQLVPLWPGQAGPAIDYAPTRVEISLAVGILALVHLAYTVLARMLSAREAAPKERTQSRVGVAGI